MRAGSVVGGRFEIVRPVGAGGMGEVYRAQDLQSGAAVAVKVLLASRLQHEARFEREARLLAELSHPRIVRYVTHGAMPSGEPYLVMEWLEGEDLSTHI